ncbi:MAG: ABC transporter ATP-binding protein [Rhodospirillaceae bacterium]|nr:ABC transporter ATP-binding protein [Rhodospirillaceae bacterium]
MTPLLEIENLLRLFVVPPPGRKNQPLFGGRDSYLHAVDRVSLTIAEGETVGLVGESGCGKSTLVRLISRLLDPTGGAIRFQGNDLAAIPAKHFSGSPERGLVQMVFQDAQDSLNPRYTAFAAIADPLKRLKRMRGAALKARVEELAGWCGLPAELLGRFPHQLSGGQKARVGIARAIAVEPKLLILDEPTSALDVSVQVVILHLLEALKRRLGMSYLFVSHDLNVVRLICDRVIVMYLGKVVESGPTERVFRAPAHPYTKALLSAIPTFEPGVRGDRQHLTGEPRSPIDPDPKVCRFYGRCPKGETRCHSEMPALAEIGRGHRAACHFPEAGPAEEDHRLPNLKIVA